MSRLRSIVLLLFAALLAGCSTSNGGPDGNSEPQAFQFNVSCTGAISSFGDFVGKTIAFTDPGALRGDELPRAYLLEEHGISPTTDMTDMYTGSHEDAVMAVYNGDVDVSATLVDARDLVRSDFPDVNEKVCVFWNSQAD